MLYIGTSNKTADVICGKSLTTKEIQDEIDKYLLPKIGEVKFVLTTGSNSNIPGLSLKNGIYYSTENFDGWVYPDESSRFSKYSFPLAYDIYEQYDTYFTIPSPYSHFFRLNNLADNGTDTVLQRNDIPLHHHKLTASGKLSSTITIDKGIVFYSSSTASIAEPSTCKVNLKLDPESDDLSTITIPQFHNGSTDPNTDVPVPLQLNIRAEDSGILLGNLQTKESTGTDKFIPTNITLPIMVYIGKNK